MKTKYLIDIRYLKTFSCVLLMRLIYMSLVQSYFVPDEYWQSLEIAHRTVFGYGYVTWEWDKAIRSFFYPFWFSVCYKLLELLNIDNVEVLVLLPRIVQSILSAVADTYFWYWLKKPELRLRKDQVYWIYFMWVMCLMVNYCSSRTLTNTAELDFSIIALYYFPWNTKQSIRKPHFLWFVGLACLVRPTAFIQWLPFCVYDIFLNPKPLKYCFTTYLNIIVKVMCLSVIIDLLFYKRFVLSPFNFILYNGKYNIGVYYGVHSWFWYFFVGVPVVLGPVVTLFYFSLCKIFKNIFQTCYKNYLIVNIWHKRIHVIENICTVTVIWTLIFYSSVAHKEFRFILPLVPLMLYLAGINVKFNQPKSNFLNIYLIKLISVCAVLWNIVGIFYLGQWHQRGPIIVISRLAQIAKENPHNSSFLFLTPCHALPFYSHIHVNVTTRFLTCEPNLSFQEFYKDESDVFFEDPSLWLDNYVLDRDVCSLPSHIVFFSNLRSSIGDQALRIEVACRCFLHWVTAGIISAYRVHRNNRLPTLQLVPSLFVTTGTGCIVTLVFLREGHSAWYQLYLGCFILLYCLRKKYSL